MAEVVGGWVEVWAGAGIRGKASRWGLTEVTTSSSTTLIIPIKSDGRGSCICEYDRIRDNDDQRSHLHDHQIDL